MNPEQPAYFPTSHPPPNGHYVSNGIDYSARVSNTHGTYPYTQPSYNPQMPYHQQQLNMYMPYQPPPTFAHANNLQVGTMPIVRPKNESQNGAPTGAPMFALRPGLFVPQQQGYSHLAQNPANFPQYSASSHMGPGSFASSPSMMNSSYPYPSQSSQVSEKRERKPLKIVDPTSHQTVDVETSAPSSGASSTVSSNEINKTQTDKKASVSVNGSLSNDNHEEKLLNGTLEPSQSDTSDDKSSTETNQNDVEDNEPDHSESFEIVEAESIHSEIISDIDNQSPEERLTSSANSSQQPQESSPPEISPPETSENIPPTSNEDDSLQANRLRYSIKELLNKRTVPLAQKRPANLKFVREIEVEKPKPVNTNDQFLRDVRLILNKLTPQTKTKLVEQLDKLELDRYERLEGMIDIIFSKALEEPKYCSMYADLCDMFQKKQVTVPNENGRTTTYSFRQILLSRCQKGFENDYRQEINYDQRKAIVDAITDEKQQKEEAENLEEALYKAKRRNFGNILFIGELFKLNMLTESIMYSCMEYLLQDKADEENLECLCRLLRTIGKKFDEKSTTQKKVERSYTELNEIIEKRQTSARTRFMIQDLFELRDAKWVARMAEVKPLTIDEIHEQDRLKREKEERERQQPRADQYRNNPGGNNGYGSNNPQLYTGTRGSRGSGSKPSNRSTTDRTDKGFNVSSIRQYQSNDKKTTGPTPLNLKPQGAWPKISTTEKKNGDDQSNANRAAKSSTNSVPSFRPQTVTSSKTSTNSNQRPSLTNGSTRDNEEHNSNNNSVTGSREGSRAVSREESRNASPDSSTNKKSVPANNQAFDEEKILSRVHALSEEYTANYSTQNDRPITDAIEDFSDFCTSNANEQAIIIRELLTNVLEAKAHARKAIGHLLSVALQKKIISNEGFLAGLQMIIEFVPDYIVDIPFVWQYIGEILGAFMGDTESNMLLLKPILQSIADDKSKQLFQYIITYAVEFASKSHVQKFWKSTGYTFDNLLKSDLIDSSFLNEYNWLSEENQDTTDPGADPELVRLFKTIDEKNPSNTDSDIHRYINEHMDTNNKYYIRNIVLSYLEARLEDRKENQPLDDFIEDQGMTILNTFIQHKPEAELQALYAIQNFITKHKHPPKMAQLLFDKFYDDDCVTEEVFHLWRTKPDPGEMDGHSEVMQSTDGFFNWLQHAELDDENAEK